MVRRLEDPRALAGQRVLVRSDLNVPIDDQGRITDPGRIEASAPTIRALAEAGARVVVTAHLGRPKGGPDPRYTLEPVVAPLARAIGREVAFHSGTVAEAGPAVEALAPGQVLLLENIRFDPRETSKDEGERAGLAAELAQLADAFVSDGFGVVHRKQASVYDVAELLPSYAGALVVREVEIADRLLHDPVRPYVVVLGGSKVSDKLGVIDSLLDRADALVIGGGMVFTFLAAQGHAVGASLLESDQIPVVQEYLRRAEESGVRIELPTDIVMAASFAADAEHWDVPVDALESTPAGSSALGLDIGPKSAQRFAGIIAEAGTVFWNGPMGVFEFPAFAQGTRAVAQALAGHSAESLTVVGGGDSAAAVRALGFDDDQFGHISTGGGASLEYLEGKDLPGLDVLKES